MRAGRAHGDHPSGPPLQQEVKLQPHSCSQASEGRAEQGLLAVLRPGCRRGPPRGPASQLDSRLEERGASGKHHVLGQSVFEGQTKPRQAWPGWVFFPFQVESASGCFAAAHSHTWPQDGLGESTGLFNRRTPSPIFDSQEVH